jgi:lipid-binding SYLF domain-containing protein
MRNRLTLVLALVALLALAPLACRKPEGETRAEKRAHVREMRTEAMAVLYKDLPATRGLVERSEGYAVFSSIGTNFGLISSARGFGILKNRNTGEDTYMSMMSLGGGFGAGVRDFRAYFVFLDKGAMDTFVEQGLEFAGQVSAIGTDGEDDNGEGIDMGAAQNLDSIQAKVMVFQITEKGLVGQATLQGTKYKVDEELN